VTRLTQEKRGDEAQRRCLNRQDLEKAICTYMEQRAEVIMHIPLESRLSER
jgi:hypothetical protein